MKLETLKLLIDASDVEQFVFYLWHDGPIKQAHERGGYIRDIIERFARLPRFFYEPSDEHIEWTHFSPWWGGILLCDYANPHVRDLRYLHEIYHAATMPYIANVNASTFEAKNFHNEWKASTVTEMAVYLELPELRRLTFEHPIFVVRFLFPYGDLTRPDEGLLARWASEPDLVFQELMYSRASIVSATDKEIDADDPQITWLRRYPEQRQNWLNVWADRYQLVEDAMIRLRLNCERLDRRQALDHHMEWLLSSEISGGTTIPFYDEACRFRAHYDELITLYETAMTDAGYQAVRHLDSAKQQD